MLRLRQPAAARARASTLAQGCVQVCVGYSRAMLCAIEISRKRTRARVCSLCGLTCTCLWSSARLSAWALGSAHAHWLARARAAFKSVRKFARVAQAKHARAGTSARLRGTCSSGHARALSNAIEGSRSHVGAHGHACWRKPLRGCPRAVWSLARAYAFARRRQRTGARAGVDVITPTCVHCALNINTIAAVAAAAVASDYIVASTRSSLARSHRNRAVAGLVAVCKSVVLTRLLGACVTGVRGGVWRCGVVAVQNALRCE